MRAQLTDFSMNLEWKNRYPHGGYPPISTAVACEIFSIQLMADTSAESKYGSDPDIGVCPQLIGDLSIRGKI